MLLVSIIKKSNKRIEESRIGLGLGLVAGTIQTNDVCPLTERRKDTSKTLQC